jgi:hypothetical protein
MTPEEIQRTMDFILQNQADSHVRMAQLEDKHYRLVEAQEATNRDLDTLVGVTRDLVRVSRQTVRRVRNPESRE